MDSTVSLDDMSLKVITLQPRQMPYQPSAAQIIAKLALICHHSRRSRNARGLIKRNLPHTDTHYLLSCASKRGGLSR